MPLKVSGIFKMPGTPASRKKKKKDAEQMPASPSASTSSLPAASSAASHAASSAASPAASSSSSHSAAPSSAASSSAPKKPILSRIVAGVKRKVTSRRSTVPKKPAHLSGRQQRDIDEELARVYPTDDAMREATSTFDKIHLRPLCKAVLRYQGYAKKLWVRWFSRTLGSTEKAEATLNKGASLPPIEEVKHFFHFVATNGQSRLKKGKTGWTSRTLHNFITTTWSMRRRHGAVPPTPEEREQINNAFATWVCSLHPSLFPVCICGRDVVCDSRDAPQVSDGSLGHKVGTHLSKTQYQVPDRPVDVSGARFNEGQHLDVSDWHSSVAFGRSEAGYEANLPLEDLTADGKMSTLVAEITTTEALVVAKFGKKTIDMVDSSDEVEADELVIAAKDAWAAAAERYTELATHISCASLPESISSVIRPTKPTRPRMSFLDTVSEKSDASMRAGSDVSMEDGHSIRSMSVMSVDESPAGASSSAGDETRLTRCVDAFIAAHPKFKKCGDITRALLDADVTCAMVLEWDSDRLRSVVPGLTPGAADLFKKHSAAWLQVHAE